MNETKMKIKRWMRTRWRRVKARTRAIWSWIKSRLKRIGNFIIDYDRWIVLVFTIVIILFTAWNWEWLTEESGNGYARRILIFAYCGLGVFYSLILNTSLIKILLKRIENFIIDEGGRLVFVGMLITPLVAWKWWEAFGDKADSGYAIRTLVFIYGALGAFYALILNARRLKVNEAGLFNDRLGRGVKALANEKPHIRTSGVRILEDLHKTAEPDKQKLIRKLLLDFICNQADIYASKKEEEKETKTESEEETKSRGWRVDIKVAIKILGELVSAENMPLVKRRKELNMQKLDLHNLDLSDAKLQRADFTEADLQKAVFNRTELQRARFVDAKLQGADFWLAKLQRANFRGADLQRANFGKAGLQRTSFQSAKLQRAVFWRANLKGARLHKADFTRTDLRNNVRNLTQEQLDNVIYEKDKPPKYLPDELKIPENRAYEWVKDENGKNKYRRFVHNKKRIY